MVDREAAVGDTQTNQQQGKWIQRVLKVPVEIAKAKLGNEIGKGQFGQAHWLKDEHGNGLPFVAKTALTAATEAELAHEAEFYDKAGEHPNIARCYGILPVDGKQALVMEGIKGRNMSGTMELLDKLRNGDAKTLAQYGRTKQISQSEYLGALQHVTLQMLNGLAHLEKQGIVHKDVRPDNIMIDQATGEVKLIDFGVAQDAGAKPTGKSPVFSGSVSPDVESGQPMTSQHDMFALGEAARKTIEADQFRYLTGKQDAQLTSQDVKAFAQPGQDGAPKQALNRRANSQPRSEAPNKFVTRVKEIAEAADKALQDQYVGATGEARALNKQLAEADDIAKMDQETAARLISDMEQNLKALVAYYPRYHGRDYDPLEVAKDAANANLEKLLADPSIARSDTGKRLAGRRQELDLICAATRLGAPADRLERMKTDIKDNVADAAGRAKVQLVDTDPLDKQIADLLAQPSVKGTRDEQTLLAKRRDLEMIDRFAGAPDPAAAIEQQLRLIRQEVEAADADLKRTGTYGAETDYTRFVNWLMHPDPTKRPSPGKLLEAIQKLDAMDDKERKAALDKIDPVKPAEAADGATQRMPIRFLADRLGDGASMRQLLAGVLGAAATAEPPPAPQQAAQQPPPQQPSTVLPVMPQQAPNVGAPNGVGGAAKRQRGNVASPRGVEGGKTVEVYSSPTGEDGERVATTYASPSGIRSGKPAGVFSSPSGEDGEKVAMSYTSPSGSAEEKAAEVDFSPTGEDGETVAMSYTSPGGNDGTKPAGVFSSPSGEDGERVAMSYSSPSGSAEEKPAPVQSSAPDDTGEKEKKGS